MFNSHIKSEQNNSVELIQQCLANYDYSNATLLAKDLVLNQKSEENKGLLADCYLAKQENHEAYFLLKNSKYPLNTYKFAVACTRLNKLDEAEKVMTCEHLFGEYNVPNGAYGLQLLAKIYKKQNKVQEAKRYYEKALQTNPRLLSVQKKLEKLGQGFSQDVAAQEVPKSFLKNPGEASNHPLSFGGTIRVGVGSIFANCQGSLLNGEGKKEDQSPEKKSSKIVGSPNETVKSDKPVFVVDEEFDEQGYEVYVNEGRVFTKKFSFPGFMNTETWIQILKQKDAGENGDYIFWYRSKRGQQQSQIEKEHSRDLQHLIEKFEGKVVEAKQRPNCIDLTVDAQGNKVKGEKATRPKVDPYCNEKDCEVYNSSEGKFYATILKLSDVSRNLDKFYIMQVLRSKKEEGKYFTFFRWGRIGTQGEFVKKMFTDPQEAVEYFEKKVSEKTVDANYQELDIYS